MKFFKHFTDNHRGQSIQTLMDEAGYFGVTAYYFIYEMCAEKLEASDDGNSDSIFRIHRRVIGNALRAQPKSVRNVLGILQKCGLLSWKEVGDVFEIDVPILLDLLDRDQKRARKTRVVSAENARLDKEEDKEEDKDKESVEKKKSRKSKVERGAILEFAHHAEHLSNTSHAVQREWLREYGDVSWISSEMSKCVGWMLDRGVENKNFGSRMSKWLANNNGSRPANSLPAEPTPELAVVKDLLDQAFESVIPPRLQGDKRAAQVLKVFGDPEHFATYLTSVFGEDNAQPANPSWRTYIEGRIMTQLKGAA